jgi:hypothetical protein
MSIVVWLFLQVRERKKGKLDGGKQVNEPLSFFPFLHQHERVNTVYDNVP